MALTFGSSVAALSYCRPFWSSEDFSCVNATAPWSKICRVKRKFDYPLTRSNLYKARIEACAKYLIAGSDNAGKSWKNGYHPLEDILDSESTPAGEARLTAAETCRTVIEVNSQASLLFYGLMSDQVQENIFWPDLPYLTDEHGNIYFQVDQDENFMQTLTSDDNYVQVVIGLNTEEFMGEMDLSDPAAIDLGFEEIKVEDDNFDNDDEEEEDGDDNENDIGGEWVDILEDDIDEVDSDGYLGGWESLETMQSSHHMYFAEKLAEVVSDVPINFMDQPSAGVAIQGLLRPVFYEEQSVVQRHWSSHHNNGAHLSKTGKPVEAKVEDCSVLTGHPNESPSSEDDSVPADDIKGDTALGNGTAFYKLEMTKIQLLSTDKNQAVVEVEDCRRARPDVIARSASRIISRVNTAGEKTIKALKFLCMRCKGIQIEEAVLIGIDSLGFDLRICSGTQVQTLRFAFNSRATSEYSAERQLNDMLFPCNKPLNVKQVQQKES